MVQKSLLENSKYLLMQIQQCTSDVASNALKYLAKNAKINVQSTLVSKLKMIAQTLDKFHEPFSRYMTFKVTFTSNEILIM